MPPPFYFIQFATFEWGIVKIAMEAGIVIWQCSDCTFARFFPVFQKGFFTTYVEYAEVFKYDFLSRVGKYVLDQILLNLCT